MTTEQTTDGVCVVDAHGDTLAQARLMGMLTAASARMPDLAELGRLIEVGHTDGARRLLARVDNELSRFLLDSEKVSGFFTTLGSAVPLEHVLGRAIASPQAWRHPPVEEIVAMLALGHEATLLGGAYNQHVVVEWLEGVQDPPAMWPLFRRLPDNSQEELLGGWLAYNPPQHREELMVMLDLREDWLGMALFEPLVNAKKFGVIRRALREHRTAFDRLAMPELLRHPEVTLEALVWLHNFPDGTPIFGPDNTVSGFGRAVLRGVMDAGMHLSAKRLQKRGQKAT